MRSLTHLLWKSHFRNKRRFFPKKSRITRKNGDKYRWKFSQDVKISCWQNWFTRWRISLGSKNHSIDKIFCYYYWIRIEYSILITDLLHQEIKLKSGPIIGSKKSILTIKESLQAINYLKKYIKLVEDLQDWITADSVWQPKKILNALKTLMSNQVSLVLQVDLWRLSLGMCFPFINVEAFVLLTRSLKLLFCAPFTSLACQGFYKSTWVEEGGLTVWVHCPAAGGGIIY